MKTDEMNELCIPLVDTPVKMVLHVVVPATMSPSDATATFAMAQKMIETVTKKTERVVQRHKGLVPSTKSVSRRRGSRKRLDPQCIKAYVEVIRNADRVLSFDERIQIAKDTGVFRNSLLKKGYLHIYEKKWMKRC